MARARFLLRPRWLLSHLFVVVLVVTMVNLGFWQLRRLDEKRELNALVEARTEQAEVAVGDLVTAGDGAAAVERARYRAVTATGTYEPDATVTVRNRSQDGAPGAWLVTPVDLDDGGRVGVVRGFVGFRPDGDLEDPPPPGGRVTVSGLAVDPGRLGGTAGRDLDPLLSGDDVLPVLLQAQDSDPPEPGGEQAGADPLTIVPVPPPELSEGPHLGYAVQWFIFSIIAVVGYPIVLRRVVQRRGKEVDDHADGPAGRDGEGQSTGDGLDRELEDLLRRGE